MLSDHLLLGDGAAGDVELEAALAARLAEARASYPAVALADEIFLPFLGAKLAGAAPALGALAQLDVAALYLACASANGDAAALAEIERSFLPRLDGALVRAGARGDAIDEVKQRLRERLFTASAGRPRVAEYGGRGDFGRWLRAVAVRIALDLHPRNHDDAEELDGLAVGLDDPEVAHLKERYRAQVRAAMQTAFRALDSEARGDLRLYYIEGLRLADLAALRSVSVSTMSRRIQTARSAVMDETRRQLLEELGRDDLESVLGLVASRLDLSRQWLETKP